MVSILWLLEGAGFLLHSFTDSGDIRVRGIQCAAVLANCLHLKLPLIQLSACLWGDAELNLRHDADHTEIYRYLSNLIEQQQPS